MLAATGVGALLVGSNGTAEPVFALHWLRSIRTEILGDRFLVVVGILPVFCSYRHICGWVHHRPAAWATFLSDPFAACVDILRGWHCLWHGLPDCYRTKCVCVQGLGGVDLRSFALQASMVAVPQTIEFKRGLRILWMLCKGCSGFCGNTYNALGLHLLA